jgi:hypothetical protein
LPLAFQPDVMVPALLADRRCTASDTVLMPRCSSSSALMTVTGEGVSESVRRRIEPVTTTSSSASACDAGASCAKTWEDGSAVAATAAANSARRTASLMD